MDNETEIIKEYVQILPQGMKDYLAKNTWPQRLSLIAQINKMSNEQASALNSEVFLILIGMEKYSDLKNNIQQNVAGIGAEAIKTTADEIEKKIFSEIKPMLVEIDEAYNELEEEGGDDENLSKDNVLNEIENPTPTKPIVSNPAGKNVVLDAQHNLPEVEKKILISSAAVPSRGPILNNFKTSFATTQPVAPIAPVVPTAQVTPSAPTLPPMPVTPPIPTIPVTPPAQPIVQPAPEVKTVPIQPVPQTPPPPAPKKYTVDPYREPLE